MTTRNARPARACACAALLAGLAGIAWGQTPDLPTPANRAATGAPATAAPARRGYDGQPNDPALPVAVIVDSPKPGETLPTNAVDVAIRVSNFTLAQGGNRVHVAFDNTRAQLVYDTSRPLRFRPVKPGGHTLRAFAVRADGTLFKNPEAFQMVSFSVMQPDQNNIPTPDEPVLTVSSPRSISFDGPAALRVPFDYRVDNVVLTPNGYRLRYSLNGRETVTHEPGPILFAGLDSVTNRLIAQVVDIEGAPVPGLFNKVAVTFYARPSAAPAPVAPPQPKPAGSSSAPALDTQPSSVPILPAQPPTPVPIPTPVPAQRPPPAPTPALPAPEAVPPPTPPQGDPPAPGYPPPSPVEIDPQEPEGPPF